MKVYYVADSKTKTRLKPVHRTLAKAIQRVEQLNKLEPGRYQVGDWCDMEDVGIHSPGDWPWRKL